MTLPRRGEKGYTLIELMITVAVIGILAALSIPAFLRFQARAKQAEVKVNLRALNDSQRAFFAESDRYGVLTEVGFQVEPGNRYTYECVDTIGNTVGPAVPLWGGTWALTDSFLAVARGNLDTDAALDFWWVWSGAPGLLFVAVDDVTA